MRLLVALIALTLSFWLFTPQVLAQENIRTGDIIVLQKDQVIDKDFFAGGEEVTIAGTINGDAYIGGGKVTVDGIINGDLITGGGDVVINGEVTQDLRAAGGNITITGKIGRNATVLGGNINFTNSSEVSGSITGGGGDFTIYGPVGRDIYLGAGNATIGNSVEGDINAGIGILTFSSDARILGNVTYVSDVDARTLPGASISGQITRNNPPHPEPSKKEAEQFFAGASFFLKIISLASLTIIGSMMIYFLPKFSLYAAETIGSRFWINLVTGVLSLILIPIIIILLLISVLGIPLSLILLCVFFIEIYISKIFVALWLGRFLSQKTNQNWNLYISLILGLISLTLLEIIPIFGAIISFIVLILGLGGLIIGKRNYYLKVKNQL